MTLNTFTKDILKTSYGERFLINIIEKSPVTEKYFSKEILQTLNQAKTNNPLLTFTYTSQTKSFKKKKHGHKTDYFQTDSCYSTDIDNKKAGYFTTADNMKDGKGSFRK